MPGTTENLGLYLPDAGESGWADEMNTNLSTLDARFDEAAGHTHSGGVSQGPKLPVTSIAAGGTADATTFLRGDGTWAGAGGGSGVTDHGDLTGLTDDDHPQYHTQARGDARWTQRANNLSDVASASASRTNLGAAAAVHQHSGADLTSGTVPTARLGSGTANATTFLRGDQTWAPLSGAGGAVSGSGTTGRAAFWSGIDVLSGIANSIFWDAVTSRIGIGTESPTAALTVDTSNKLSAPTSGFAQVYRTILDAFVVDDTTNCHVDAVTYTPPTAPTGGPILTARRSFMTAKSAHSYTLQMRAIHGGAYHDGAGVLSGPIQGVYGQVQELAGGTIADASGVAGIVQANSTGKVTTGTALRALRPDSVAVANFGDTYGVYVEDQVPSGGATHQTGMANGIYQAGVTNRNTFKGPTVFDAPVTFNAGTTGAGGSGTVGGTGVAGRAAFWSALSTLSAYAMSLFWDATTNRLGIGTETPGAAFHLDTSNRLSSPTAGTAQTFSTTLDAFALSGTSNITAYSAAYTPPTQPTGTRIFSSIRPSVSAASAFDYGLTMRAVNAAATFSGTGTLSGVTSGVFGQVSSTAAGILSAAYGVAGFLQASSTGKITTGSALRAVQPQSASVANYGDTYGLYIEDQVPTGGATHQTGTANGLYQAGTTTQNTFKGPSVFDGKATFNGGTVGIPRSLGVGYLSGAQVVANDVGANFTVDVNMTLTGVRIYAKTPPAGSAMTIDIKRSTDSGATYTTIFSTLPTIAAAARVGGAAAVLSVTSVNAGDIFRVDVTAIGSTTPGSDVTVQLNGSTR